MEKQCRLCMEKELGRSDLIDLKTDKTGEILNKINSCLFFKVSLDVNLPHKICKKCYMNVVELSSFQGKCLENDRKQRKKFNLPATIMTRNSAPIIVQPRQHTLSDHGMKLLRQNICTLNDKIAQMSQERDLLNLKIGDLQKENDTLRISIVQHSKTLPTITKTMTSLLSRMEQQFLLSNSRFVDANIEVQEVEQMDTNYGDGEWTTATVQPVQEIQIPSVTQQDTQVAYICDPLIDHVTEVEVDCDTGQASSPSVRGDSPVSYYEEEVEQEVSTENVSDVNELLVRLCEQQEQRYQAGQSSTVTVLPVTRKQTRAATAADKNVVTAVRKTDHYELLVPRRSFLAS